ncbi:hypothetical protein SAMN06296036_11872 [Pseudobacteriovorax antillogorgiicola]|uniref:Uncharacterized protein n=2 Tax=Pseudobacteriovorax antillogorgiicola TaxID=1513793 RepID=A0A1Y6CE72_9BACT|nr:hypothetical protein EDD56_11869 [Pseudobacteriovorax antillogorgiicola]SMF56892.1 hypothetical protein SAMN06296036_11872 [Pseudobacteriovorax antillogorgiicola]
MILRYPKAGGSSNSIQANQFQGYSWTPSPIQIGTPIYFGEVVVTEENSRVKIQGQNQLLADIGPKTRVQFVPSFQKMKNQQGIHPRLLLHEGIARVYAQPDLGALDCRVSRLLIEADEVDYLIQKTGKKIEIFNFGTSLEIQEESASGERLFQDSLRAFLIKKFKRLIRLTQDRVKLQPQRSVTLELGQKLLVLDDLGASEIQSLELVMGAEQAANYIAKGRSFEAQLVQSEDFERLTSYIQDIGDIEQMVVGLDLQTDQDELLGDEIQPILDELPTKDPTPPTATKTSTKAPINQTFSYRLGAAGLYGRFTNGKSLYGGGGSLELEVRPWDFLYLSLNMARGDWIADGMNDYFGLNKPDALNSEYFHLAFGAGLRTTPWDRISIGVGVALIDVQQLIIQYDDSPSNVNRTYSLIFPLVPMLEGKITINLFSRLEFYMGYGASQVQLKVQARDLSAEYSPVLNLAFASLGFAWTSP